MSATISSSEIYTDFQGLQGLKRDARENPDSALKQVTKQFEAMFLQMMLKSMRDASFGDELFGSDQMESYQGMFDSQLAMHLSQGRGIGLSESLERQLRGSIKLPSSDDDITDTDKASAYSSQQAARLRESAQTIANTASVKQQGLVQVYQQTAAH